MEEVIMKTSKSTWRHCAISIGCVVFLIVALLPSEGYARRRELATKAYSDFLWKLVEDAYSILSDAKEVLEAAQAQLATAQLAIASAGSGAVVAKATAAVATAGSAVATAVTGVQVAICAASAATIGTGAGQLISYGISYIWDPICPIEVPDAKYMYPTNAEVDSWIPNMILGATNVSLARADFDYADTIVPGSGTASWEFMREGARGFAIAMRGAGAFTDGRRSDVQRAAIDLQALLPVYTGAIERFAGLLASTPTFTGNPMDAIQNARFELDALEAGYPWTPSDVPDPAALLAAINLARSALDQAESALQAAGDGTGKAIMLDGDIFQPLTLQEFLQWLDDCRVNGVACLPEAEIQVADYLVNVLGVTYNGVPSITASIAEWDGLGDTGNEAALFSANGGLLKISEGLTTAIANYWDRINIFESPLVLTWAYDPNPANVATGVDRTPTLSWMPGYFAASHDVYFSDNFADVNEATISTPGIYKGRQDPNYYVPGTLELNTTYYWRIDEVNLPNIWKGDVWSFTTANYLVVDDFESYTNIPPNRIFDTWKKGGGGTVGYPDPNYAELTIIHGDKQSMPFDYNNLASNYSEDSQTFATPQDWTAYGVKALSLWLRGYMAPVGSFVESPPGVYTMTASGTDIWDVPDLRRPSKFHDEFHYAYMQVSGCEIVAKVESITNTNAWAKAGVMIRDSIDSNSAHAMMCITPGSGISFQYRDTTGGASASATQAGIAAPYWISLQRTYNETAGNYELTAGYSPTGESGSWTQLGLSVAIPMTDPVCIGLSLTSHNAAATCTAVFSNVALYDGDGNPVVPLWTHQDIGIKSNTAAPLYVTLQDSTNAKKTITHPDPDIVLQNTWQEWNIALSDFTGVDPKKITKITIGVGDSTPRGTGTLYIDDIRLYIPRCMSGRPGPAGDFTNDCIVDYADLQTLTDNWLATPPQNPAIDIYEDGAIDLRDYATLANAWLEESLWPK